MKKRKFIAVFAASALLLGTALTSCQTTQNCPDKVVVEEKHHYGISVQQGEHGKITSNVSTALVGEDVVFTVAPENGYSLVELKINGADKLSSVKNNSFTEKMVEGGLSVLARFDLKTYKVNIKTDGNGLITSSIAEGHTGDAVTLKVVANGGFELESLLINNEDKTFDVLNGVYSTTLLDADLNVDATFAPLSTKGELVNQLKTKLTNAVSDEIAAIKVKEIDRAFDNTTKVKEFSNFKSVQEGDYAVLRETWTKVDASGTSSISKDEVTKTTLNADNSLYTIYQRIKDGKLSGSPSLSKVAANDKNKESIELNNGKGLLGVHAGALPTAVQENALLFDLKFEANLITFKYEAYAKNEISATDYNETYETYDCRYEFNANGTIKLASTNKKVYKNTVNEWSNKINFKYDAATKKVTLEPTAKTSAVVAKDLEFTYGEVVEEVGTTKLPLASSLFIDSFGVKITKGWGTEQVLEDPELGSYKLNIGQEYKIALDNVLPVENANCGDKIVGFDITPDFKNVVDARVGYDGKLNITLTGTVVYGELTINTLNASTIIVIHSGREAITSLTLESYGTTVETGQTLELGLSANDPSCDTSAAFEFVGDSLGCKVIYDEMLEGYVLQAGNTPGQVTLEAISSVDSSVRSNQLVVTVKGQATFNDLLNMTYMQQMGAIGVTDELWGTITLTGDETTGGTATSDKDPNGVAFTVKTDVSGNKVLEFAKGLLVYGNFQNKGEGNYYINKLYYNDSIASNDPMTWEPIIVKGFRIAQVYQEASCTTAIDTQMVNLIDASTMM